MALNNTHVTYDVTFREYAVAYMVLHKDISSAILSSKLGLEFILADSQQDAEGKILSKILNNHSINDGYLGHTVTAMNVFSKKENGTE